MTGIQPWRQLSEQLLFWVLKSLSWNLKRFKAGWMSVFSGNAHKHLPARRWLFSVAVLQEDGRELLPHVFFIFPTYFLAYNSRFYVILSFVFPVVVLSLFPEESHITDIYCFREKGNWGREVLILAAGRSHYSLAFLLTGSLSALQAELIQIQGQPAPLSAVQGREKERTSWPCLLFVR